MFKYSKFSSFCTKYTYCQIFLRFLTNYYVFPTNAGGRSSVGFVCECRAPDTNLYATRHSLERGVFRLGRIFRPNFCVRIEGFPLTRIGTAERGELGLQKGANWDCRKGRFGYSCLWPGIPFNIQHSKRKTLVQNSEFTVHFDTVFCDSTVLPLTGLAQGY